MDLQRTITLWGILLIVSGCGVTSPAAITTPSNVSVAVPSPTSMPTPTMLVTIATASTTRGVLPTQTPARSLARNLFWDKGCAECHAANGGGGAKANAPRIRGTRLPYEQVIRVVRTGRGAMPPYPDEEISDAELRTIYDWLRSGN